MKVLSFETSLNPCCFGTYLLSFLEEIGKMRELNCLNPCCFGTYLLSLRHAPQERQKLHKS